MVGCRLCCGVLCVVWCVCCVVCCGVWCCVLWCVVWCVVVCDMRVCVCCGVWCCVLWCLVWCLVWCVVVCVHEIVGVVCCCFDALRFCVKSLSLSLSLSQRSSSCFPVSFVGFPTAHLSFVCLSHGGGSLAPVSQNHAEQDVDSELAFQLRPSYRRWIAKPCLGARFRATAVIREHAHIASTTESASWHTDAVSLSLDQPQIGVVQYQLTGTNPEPPTVRTPGQYQPAGNNEAPLAGEDLNLRRHR